MQSIFNNRKNKISKLKIYRKNNTTFLPKEIPDNLFKACPNCNENITNEEWESNLYVCSKCENRCTGEN